MRYQVPQFVDIEDKIIGPFTLKQFLMYLFAVLSLIPVYLFSDLSLFITIALPVLGTAAAFAHVRINGKSLSVTIFNAVHFFMNTQLYIWRRTPSQSLFHIQDPEWEELRNQNKALSSSPLSHMAQTLETEGGMVKAEEVEDPFDSPTIKESVVT